MESLIEAGRVSIVIVKDLSRFGREHLLCGHYTEIVYPTLGVNFIAIQENVDTTKGMGTEMMPFHNISNHKRIIRLFRTHRKKSSAKTFG